MMSGISVLAWLWLSVAGRVLSGQIASTSVPCSGERIMDALQRMERTLISEIQQAKYPGAASGTGTELLAVKNTLSILEMKQREIETNQKAMETELKETKTKLKAAETALLTLNQKGGSTFVRWGRKTCSNTSQLVYSGVAGGSWYDHPGAAANPLCLTLAPQFDGTAAHPKHRGYLYGAEYEAIPVHDDHDVPCSVCRAALSTTIMIPATRSCPTGWTTQYTGYLASGEYSHKAASEYVCIDKDRETASGGHLNQNGYLFYYTVTQCGSLPCPPYTNNKVVLCVVCSR